MRDKTRLIRLCLIFFVESFMRGREKNSISFFLIMQSFYLFAVFISIQRQLSAPASPTPHFGSVR